MGTKSAISTNKDGVALDGYDVVAYFTKGEPTTGSADVTHDWNGATWFFSSEENRDLFTADPEKYAPQFGGYCSVGKLMGLTMSGSPKQFRIDEDKLFLNKDAMVQAVSKPLTGTIRKRAAKQ